MVKQCNNNSAIQSNYYFRIYPVYTFNLHFHSWKLGRKLLFKETKALIFITIFVLLNISLSNSYFQLCLFFKLSGNLSLNGNWLFLSLWLSCAAPISLTQHTHTPSHIYFVRAVLTFYALWYHFNIKGTKYPISYLNCFWKPDVFGNVKIITAIFCLFPDFQTLHVLEQA